MKVESKIRRAYEFFCFVIIVFYIFLLFVQVIFNFDTHSFVLLTRIDLLFALFLLLEFILRLKNEKDKLRYLKHNWSDIIAITPINFILFALIGLTGPLLIFKVISIIRIIALYKFSRKISDEVLEFAEKTKLIYGLAIYLVIIVFGSVLIFYIERGVNPEFHNLGDSFWFMIQTITTVGYGDVVPITGAGRIIGLIAMFTAIAFSSLLTATTTSALLEKFRKERDKTRKQSKKTIEHLFDKLTGLENQINDIKSETDGLKEIKSEIEDLKKIMEKER